MNKNKKLWIGAVSFLMACLLFAVVLVIQSSMQEEIVYEEVICAKGNVTANTRITEQNITEYFEKQEMPVEWLPEGYITDTGEVYGKVIKADLSAGTILTNKSMKIYEDYYAGYRQLTWISVNVEELFAGVAGTLRTGDYIDVYSLYPQEDEIKCSLLAEKVRIASVYNSSGASIEPDDTKGLSQLIVIPMEKEQVSLFYTSLAQGKIRIAKYEA